jgi:uncharacterized damage-inducible protein DinB
VCSFSNTRFARKPFQTGRWHRRWQTPRRAGDVSVRPRGHFAKDREEVGSARSQTVLVSDRVSLIRRASDNAGSLQASEAIGQDVGRDPLERPGELAVTDLPKQEQVPDDQERPAVADQVQSVGNRTDGPISEGQSVRSTGHRGQRTREPCSLQVTNDRFAAPCHFRFASVNPEQEDFMSQTAAALLAELEQEALATRRVLERIPEDKLDWRPHPKSKSLGELSDHVAGIPGFVSQMATRDQHDPSKSAAPPARSSSRAEILSRLDASLEQARSVMSGFPEDELGLPFTLRFEGREVFTIPRIGVLRTMLLNHWYHHRGQLTVYLRLLGVPVPAVYGRSADEMFAQAPAA